MPAEGGASTQIDGEPATLLRADLLFRGVALPAGEHTVELTYRPAKVRAALWIAPLALLSLLGLCVIRRPESR